MRLTEIIQIKSSIKVSKLCHLAKNLYNLANWYFRQDLFNLNNFLSYYDLDFILKNKEAYRQLPSQTSQQILKLVSRNWKSYFRGLKEYKKNYKKFKKKPKIPNYKKKNGESIVIFTNQQCKIKEGYLYFTKKVNFKPIKTRIKERLKEVRIIPLGINYKIEIIYEKEEQDLGLNQEIGIYFDKIDESYTSKCSFLDNEEIKKHENYIGRRISRGLFRSSNKTIINADVNAGYNIMRKAFPNSILVDGIEAFGLMPQIIQQNIVDNII